MQTETTVIDLSSLSGFIGLSTLLESGEIEEIAKSCGFVCRSSSRISGTAFLQMMTQIIDSGTDWSLMDQCFYLEDKHNIVMTKQGLDGRYHTFSVSAPLRNGYEISFHFRHSGGNQKTDTDSLSPSTAKKPSEI